LLRTLEMSRLVTEHEAAERLRVSVRTLQKWRLPGNGPRFVKLGRERERLCNGQARSERGIRVVWLLRISAREFAFAIDDLPAGAELEALLGGGPLVADPDLRAALECLPLARDGDEVGANVEDEVVSALRVARPGDELPLVAAEVRVSRLEPLGEMAATSS
jgi:hypothetical protein